MKNLFSLIKGGKRMFQQRRHSHGMMQPPRAQVRRGRPPQYQPRYNDVQQFHPSQWQGQQPKKRSAWSAPFTNSEGRFDISRTASSVDQFVKTFQQVTPIVSKVGRFFKP